MKKQVWVLAACSAAMAGVGYLLSRVSKESQSESDITGIELDALQRVARAICGEEGFEEMTLSEMQMLYDEVLGEEDDLKRYAGLTGATIPELVERCASLGYWDA